MLVFHIARRVVLQQSSRPFAQFAGRACYATLRPPTLRRSAPRQLSTLPPPQPPAVSTWVDRVPATVRPYLYLIRLDKPIGTILIFYPFAWSAMMASYAVQAPITTSISSLALCGFTAFVLRSAACTINDIWDRDIDRAVERTKRRPLANGDITIPRASIYLGAQAAVGLGIFLQFDWYNALYGVSALSLITLYPLMKRITYWPQAFLGLAIDWGALFGWAAVAGSADLNVCVPLFAGAMCWTIVYDTLYAHQDKIEDARIGVRSTALLFGSRTTPILSAFSASSISFITLAGYMNASGIPFYVGVGIGAVQLAKVLKITDLDNPMSCWKAFHSCGWAGFWIWMGALADYLTIIV